MLVLHEQNVHLPSEVLLAAIAEMRNVEIHTQGAVSQEESAHEAWDYDVTSNPVPRNWVPI